MSNESGQFFCGVPCVWFKPGQVPYVPKRLVAQGMRQFAYRVAMCLIVGRLIDAHI